MFMKSLIKKDFGNSYRTVTASDIPVGCVCEDRNWVVRTFPRTTEKYTSGVDFVKP